MREWYSTPKNQRPAAEQNCTGCRTTLDNHLICPCHPEIDGMDMEPSYSPRRRMDAKPTHPVILACCLALWVGALFLAGAYATCAFSGRLCYVVEAI